MRAEARGGSGEGILGWLHTKIKKKRRKRSSREFFFFFFFFFFIHYSRAGLTYGEAMGRALKA